MTAPLPAPPNLPEPTAQNRAINGLRGFSALCVVLYHLHNMATGAAFFRPQYPPSVQTLIAGTGHFGVMLFFMISGYLILRSLSRHGSIGRFLKLRVVRIYPVFLLLHLLLFTVGPLRHYEWMAHLSPASYVIHFLSNLLFLPGVLDLPIAQKNAWSLSYEATFYVLAALLYFATRPNNRLLWLRRAALAAGLVGAGAFLYHRPYAGFLLVGVLLHFAQERFAGSLERVAQTPWLGGVGLLAAFIAFAFADAGLAVPVLFPIALLCAGGFFATIIAERGGFAALLQTRPLQYFGIISYSFYLIHPFVLDPLRAAFRPVAASLQSEMWTTVLFVASGLLVATVVADLSHRLVETAFTNRYLRAWASR